MKKEKNLKPRDRILMSLQHKEPDCIPYDLGGTSITGIHLVAYQNLVRYLGKDSLLREDKKSWYYDRLQGLAKVAEEIKQELEVDTHIARFKNPSTWKFQIEETGDKEAFTDELGCQWVRSKANITLITDQGDLIL